MKNIFALVFINGIEEISLAGIRSQLYKINGDYIGVTAGCFKKFDFVKSVFYFFAFFFFLTFGLTLTNALVIAVKSASVFAGEFFFAIPAKLHKLFHTHS
jgi:hypothetical protein